MSKFDCINIASSFSGIIEVLVSHPLDRIKTELQIMALNNKKPTISLGIKQIYEKNKLRGFYSGIIPRLIGIVPMRLTYWSSMTISSDYMKKDKEEITEYLNKYISTKNINMMINIFPGLITGFVQSIIDNPIEVIKIKLMTGTKNIEINKLYQGFNYLLARNIIFAIPVAYSVNTFGKDNAFLAGAFGGVIGSIISHPLDVMKTEKQRNRKEKNTKITLRFLISKNPQYLFSGLTMRTSLSFVNMGIGFMVFEHIYNLLYKLND
jgi:hypothetical protein